MSRRYLFGPVSTAFADLYLAEERAAERCRAFGPEAGVDLLLDSQSTWSDVLEQLPEGWSPDVLVLYLPYTHIPACLWNAPVPIIGLAADWNLLWHQYVEQARYCDLLLTDTVGVEHLARAGISQVRAVNLYGCTEAWQGDPWPEETRDVDVLFVGNFHPAVQAERLPWLARLSGLVERWQVQLTAGVFGDDYRRLLSRARIVFNRGIRSECNRRAIEATLAGALLFQEADNREVPQLFTPEHEYVPYTADNLERLLEYYLTHEQERRTIAAAGQARAQRYTFQQFWQQTLADLEIAWPTLQERARQRPSLTPDQELVLAAWERVSAPAPGSVSAQERASAARSEADAALLNTLGVLQPAVVSQPGASKQSAQWAAACFQRAIQQEPAFLLAGLNFVEALLAAGDQDTAKAAARQLLRRLDRLPASAITGLDAVPYPPGFSWFRVLWEQAGWQQAGQPQAERAAKLNLLRWRLETLLAELEQHVGHAYEAVLARPDVPLSQALLGRLLLEQQQPQAAARHLRAALTANPFDTDSARLLRAALMAAEAQQQVPLLARERRRLAQAAPTLVPPEPWFLEAAPVGDELASLIILCCNEVAITRLCLESVLQHTRSPYELILIDNASNDDTPDYLQEIQQRPGPERVVVLRNDVNVGFPAGCNQGLAQARGRYLVFLNNDAVVTAGWLEGLIAWLLHDWPKVGLVGPVTNYAAPPQQIPVSYTDLEDLAAFAARRQQEHAHQAQAFERLSGFCLVTRREVLDRIGGFDERYGLGFFDDDDLGLRARAAGFTLLIARNIFVHHFGSRTFRNLGIDCQQQLEQNFALFRERWGPERTAGYRLPDARPAATPTAEPARPAPAAASVSAEPVGPPRVSLCMIVRNEEHNLAECLGPVRDLVQEIVVVDTGSSDRTRDIARSQGAQVFEFPWVDSFAAARNESLRHATGDWICWLDADDRLDATNRAKFRALLAGLDRQPAAYVVNCLCVPDPVTQVGTTVKHVRLFRHDPRLRWRYRVHEQILPALRQLEYPVRWSDLVIQHVGYVDPALRRRKLDRDLRLLRLDQAEEPNDPFTLFNLAAIHQELGQHAEALPLIERSLHGSHPTDSIVRKLYSMAAQSYRQLGQTARTLETCQAGRRLYPDDPELLFLEALARRDLGERETAIQALEKLLQTSEGEYFSSGNAGIRGHLALHNLALLHHEQKRPQEAERWWRAALADNPDYRPSWQALLDLLLSQQRWAEVEALLQQAEHRQPGTLEGTVFRARLHLARQEFALARLLLEEACARQPHDPWPLEILSHVLLQEGQDLATAEQVLQRILRLRPDHPGARHNLTLLRRKLGRSGAADRDSPA